MLVERLDKVANLSQLFRRWFRSRILKIEIFKWTSQEHLNCKISKVSLVDQHQFEIYDKTWPTEWYFMLIYTEKGSSSVLFEYMFWVVGIFCNFEKRCSHPHLVPYHLYLGSTRFVGSPECLIDHVLSIVANCTYVFLPFFYQSLCIEVVYFLHWCTFPAPSMYSCVQVCVSYLV